MITTAKSTKKIVGILAIVCILVISVGLMVSRISTQEAYAEKKKITGTSKVIDLLSRTKIPVPKTTVKGYLIVYNAVFSSADPDWNNARFFFVHYKESTDGNKAYGVITHPSGDQTFIEFTEELPSVSGTDIKGETEGFFLKGTGKFKNIRARWKSKWMHNYSGGERIDEWTVEYF